MLKFEQLLFGHHEDIPKSENSMWEVRWAGPSSFPHIRILKRNLKNECPVLPNMLVCAFSDFHVPRCHLRVSGIHLTLLAIGLPATVPPDLGGGPGEFLVGASSLSMAFLS